MSNEKKMLVKKSYTNYAALQQNQKLTRFMQGQFRKVSDRIDFEEGDHQERSD